MTEADTSAFTSVEQLCDSAGYVDLRVHQFDPSKVAILRKISQAEPEWLWFPAAHRIQFSPKGRAMAQQFRIRKNAIDSASHYRFNDCERSLLILLHRQDVPPGMSKALTHDEAAGCGFPQDAVHAAYRSLHEKGLAHTNSKGLVLEPHGTVVAHGVYEQMLGQRCADSFTDPEPPTDQPLILSALEKAIYPWFVTLSNQWQPTPETLTDAEEKAMGRLIAGGFIEAKVKVMLNPIGNGLRLGAIWRVSGPFSDRFEHEMRNHFAARGYAGASVRMSRKVTMLRLTAEGERAKEDFAGNHEFKKPLGSTSGMPKPLFDIIAGGPDGTGGCLGAVSVVLDSEISDLPPNAPASPPVAASDITILFLSSDPRDGDRLRLGEEIREIEHRLALAKRGRKCHFCVKTSVRPSDLTQAIFDERPEIIHFSGHGTTAGELCFENQNGNASVISTTALAGLFQLIANQVRCVVLNACYSEAQARAIAEHIPYVIGMQKEIGDEAAIVFATGFYKALAADESIPRAFQFGVVELQLMSNPDDLTPVLIEGPPSPSDREPGVHKSR